MFKVIYQSFLNPLRNDNFSASFLLLFIGKLRKINYDIEISNIKVLGVVAAVQGSITNTC